MRKQTNRLLSRLVAGLFAVQIVVTGFCLLSSHAHAMPMHQMSSSSLSHTMMTGMDGACGKSAHMDGEHNGTSHSGGCFHCDEPDQFVKAAPVDVTPVSVILACVALMQSDMNPGVSEMPVGVSLSTGPPRSSSLLFTTTRRIRV